MSIEISIGTWGQQQSVAQVIRYEVFVIEQNIPVELEWDEMDAVSLHAIAYNAHGEAVGTGRLLPDGHIGRMAVRENARGLGIGGIILNALISEAQKRGDPVVMLNAQITAEPFYLHHGFFRQGDEFMEAGIAHIAMHRPLA